MLIWSLHLWIKERVGPGDVILTVAVAFRILQGSRDLAFAAVNATQFISRIADAIQVIGEDHKVVDGPNVQQLVHQGGSIAFERGQRVGLVGPSGARKSTLFSLVQRLFDIDGGWLLIAQ